MKYSVSKSLPLLVLVVSLGGCVPETSNIHDSNKQTISTNNKETPNEFNAAKVRITATGLIYLNEKQISLDELKVALARLKQENGSVWYYRENPQEASAKEATAVIQAIINLGLPIRLSSKPDFRFCRHG